MATLEQVKVWATEVYAREHAAWFGQSNKQLAKLVIVDVAATDGYSRSMDTIWLGIAGHDISDATDGVNDWPMWKQRLIHEMLHEFQFAEEFQVSDKARELYRMHQTSPSIPKTLFGFSDDGHDERFYESICIHAARFNTTPEELLQYL